MKPQFITVAKGVSDTDTAVCLNVHGATKQCVKPIHIHRREAIILAQNLLDEVLRLDKNIIPDIF